MAGANNKALAKAGMSKANIETYRATPMTPMKRQQRAEAIELRHNPERQARQEAAAKDFRAKSALTLRANAAKLVAERTSAKATKKTRKPTNDDVERWKDALIEHESTRLPYDHPRRRHLGGERLAAVRRAAKNAAEKLSKHGLMPSQTEIRALATAP